tara:strand:+ start:316 stop:651 length:336 start_codon:yes stop_codon:yes gene_type:complete
MKIDPRELPSQPEARLRWLAEELTKRVRYKDRYRELLTHTNTYEFNEITPKITHTNSTEKFTVLFCEYGQVTVNEVLTLNGSDILICQHLGKDYNLKNEFLDTGSKIYAFI